jgi:hypothetical protein
MGGIKMKSIYQETKSDYKDTHLWITVKAYYPELETEADLPALISIEQGKYIDYQTYPLKRDTIKWHTIETSNQSQIIREAINLIDTTWEKLMEVKE